MTLYQLSFDFTPSVATRRHRCKPSWRVSLLARRYRIPVDQAEIYAQEMRLPTREGQI